MRQNLRVSPLTVVGEIKTLTLGLFFNAQSNCIFANQQGNDAAALRLSVMPAFVVTASLRATMTFDA